MGFGIALAIAGKSIPYIVSVVLIIALVAAIFYISVEDFAKGEKQQPQHQPGCRELAIHQLRDLMYSSIPILLVIETDEDRETATLMLFSCVYIKNLNHKTFFLFIPVKGETYKDGLETIVGFLQYNKIDIGLNDEKGTVINWEIVKQKIVSKLPVNTCFIVDNADKTERKLLKWLKQLNRPIIMMASTPQPQLEKMFPNLRTFDFSRPFKEISN